MKQFEQETARVVSCGTSRESPRGRKAWATAKAAETREAIGDWKAKRESKKLTARSDRAEAYAADAVFFAAATVDEAEAAILEAAVARRDSDATQPAARTE